MKIELNFVKDRDGNPSVVISSPEKEDMVIKKVDPELFRDITEFEFDLEKNIGAIGETLSTEDEHDPEENLHIWAWKSKLNNELYGMGLMNENGSGSTIDISKSAYKKFKKAKPLYKLEIAYKQFKEVIEDRIV